MTQRPGNESSRRAATAQTRPRIVAYLACSLDGFIADPQGGVGWLDDYGDADTGVAAFMKRVGLMVMGRKTFDDSRKLGPPPKMDAETIVLTHGALPEEQRTGHTTLSGPACEIAATLRERAPTGKDVWLMGGGQVLADFLDAGEVDVLDLFVMPVLLREGIPLFPPRAGDRIPLRLEHATHLPNGVTRLTYRPDHRRS